MNDKNLTIPAPFQSSVAQQRRGALLAYQQYLQEVADVLDNDLLAETTEVSFLGANWSQLLAAFGPAVLEGVSLATAVLNAGGLEK